MQIHRNASSCGNICVPFLPLWWNGRSKPNVVWDSLHKYVVSKHIPRCSFRTSKCILSTPSQLRCSLKTPFEAQMLFSEHPPNSDVVQKHLPSSDVVQKHPPSSDMVWKHTRTTDVVWKHPLSSDMGQTPGQMSSLPCSGVGSVFPGAPAWRIVAGFSRHISPDLGQASPLSHQISRLTRYPSNIIYSIHNPPPVILTRRISSQQCLHQVSVDEADAGEPQW